MRTAAILILIVALCGVGAAQDAEPRIAVSRGEGGPASDERELIAVALDGTVDELLLSNGCVNSPRWASPDGARLLFFARSPGGRCPAEGLHALDLASREVTLLATADGVVSPDGTRMLETRYVPQPGVWYVGPFELVLWDLETGESETLAGGWTTYILGLRAGWSADGASVAYESVIGLTGMPAITIHDPDSGEFTLIEGASALDAETGAPDPAYNQFDLISPETPVVWGPQRRQAAYVARTSYHDELKLAMPGVWIYDSETAAGGGLHPIGENGKQPAWSPDGRLAYVSWDIEVVEVTSGSGATTPAPGQQTFNLHVIEGGENRVIYSLPATLDSPVWLP